MKNSHRAAAGAAALLVAGIVSVSSAGVASATTDPPGTCTPLAKADRISSAQLKAGILQAATLERQASTSPLAVHPMGHRPPPPIS
jgi:hypothetical protein